MSPTARPLASGAVEKIGVKNSSLKFGGFVANLKDCHPHVLSASGITSHLEAFKAAPKKHFGLAPVRSVDVRRVLGIVLSIHGSPPLRIRLIPGPIIHAFFKFFQLFAIHCAALFMRSINTRITAIDAPAENAAE